MKFCLLTVASAILILLSGCAHDTSVVRRESDRVQAPSWVARKPANTSSTLYFTASALRSGESEARASAIVRASAEIANYFGAFVKVVTSDVQRVSGGVDETDLTISATVVGTPVVLRGMEQQASWCRTSDGGYECHVLVAYPVSEYQRARSEVAAAEAAYRVRQSQAAARSLALYRQALADESSGRFDAALSALEQASGIVRGFEFGIELDDPAIRNTELLAPAISDAQARIGAMSSEAASWIAVSVVSVVDGRRAEQAESRFFANVAGLARADAFKARAVRVDRELAARCLDGEPSSVRQTAGGAGHLLVIDVESRFSSEMYGQFFARASGRWAILETRSGRVVASGPVAGEKGAGVSRESACEDAVDKAWENRIGGALAGAFGGLVKIR